MGNSISGKSVVTILAGYLHVAHTQAAWEALSKVIVVYYIDHDHADKHFQTNLQNQSTEIFLIRNMMFLIEQRLFTAVQSICMSIPSSPYRPVRPVRTRRDTACAFRLEDKSRRD